MTNYPVLNHIPGTNIMEEHSYIELCRYIGQRIDTTYPINIFTFIDEYVKLISDPGFIEVNGHDPGDISTYILNNWNTTEKLLESSNNYYNIGVNNESTNH
jgi:hypothetical protein